MASKQAAPAKRETAAGVYAERLARAMQLTADIREKLTKHAARQVTDPRNWGFVGDLGYLNQQLAEALRILNSGAEG